MLPERTNAERQIGAVEPRQLSTGYLNLPQTEDQEEDE